jgi:hypothetical protein
MDKGTLIQVMNILNAEREHNHNLLKNRVVFDLDAYDASEIVGKIKVLETLIAEFDEKCGL